MNMNLSNKEIKDLLEMVSIIEDEIGLLDKQRKLKAKLKKALQPIKISSRKSKGRELQKFICRGISGIIDIEYNQDDDECFIHSREMGQNGCDIILRGEAKDKFPFSIECKNSERINIFKTIEQAKSNQQNDTFPMVVFKRNYDNPYVVLDWFVFVKLFIAVEKGFKKWNL